MNKKGIFGGDKTIKMRRSRLAKALEFRFVAGRWRRMLIAVVVRLEGGEMTSLSLRQTLANEHGVHVGKYSYGSLLVPGFCDRHTTIGDYVSIGPNVRRFGAAHPLDRLSLHPYFYNVSLGLARPEDEVARSSLDIGADVWIGANVTILPGCESIGVGAVIGAGSVVVSNVPNYAIVAGNPAKILRYRFDVNERDRLLALAYWQLPPERLEEMVRAHQLRKFPGHP